MTSESVGHRKWRRVLLTGTVSLGLGLVGLSLYRSIYRRVALERIEQAQIELSSAWRQASFRKLEGFDAGCELLRQTEALQAIAATNNAAAEALIVAVGSFLRAYSHGDVEAYERFRFPIPPTLANSSWNQSQMEFYSAMASELGIKFGDVSFAESNRMVMTRLFEAHHQLTRAAPGVFETRFLTHIAPERTRAEIGEYSDSFASVTPWALEDGGLNLVAPQPTVLFRVDAPSPTQPAVTVARVRILCRTRLGAGVFPIYLRFFWHAEGECFAPTELVIPLNPTEVPDLLF
jgi:hypothetical protein